MTATVVALLATALVLWSPERTDVAVRVRALAAPGATPSPRPGGGPRRSWALAGAAGVAAGVLVGGLLGVAASVVVAVLAERVLRRGSDHAEKEGAALTGDLPVACDLLAVCLAAGLPVGAALAAVAATVPAPLGPTLAEVAALHGLGASPRRSWAGVPGELAGLGRVLVRAGESGSAVVPALRSLGPTPAPRRAATLMPPYAGRGCGSSRRWVPASCRRSSVWAWRLSFSASPRTSSGEQRPSSTGRTPVHRSASAVGPMRRRCERRGSGPVGGPHDGGGPVTDSPAAHLDPAEPEEAELPVGEGAAAPTGRLRARWSRVRATGEAGMSTAEYAVGTVAACAFAAVLYRVVTGGSVVDALGELVSSALATLS